MDKFGGISMLFDVVTFGDLCADLVLNDKDIKPEFGQTEKLIEGYSLEMGGSCSIFACQCAKLGLKTAVIGKVGDDLLGRLIIETLEKSGVCTDYIIKDKKLRTGISAALNNGTDRAILTYKGTIDCIETNDIPYDVLHNTRHLHIGSYFLMKKLQKEYTDICPDLRKAGISVSLDTNWDPEQKWDSGIYELLKYVNIFLPNENEIKLIANKDTIKDAVNKLKDYIPIIAIKMGADGAAVYSNNNVTKCSALSLKPVDTIGAGDNFDAGFLYAWLSGLELDKCIKIGCMVGGLSTLKSGGVKGQPSIYEIKNYL